MIAATAATPALATISYVGGGTWNWGTPGGNNWSHYYHASRWHGSSVTGDNGLVRSSCTRPGVWSYSNARDTAWWRVDHAYWRYC